MAGTIHSWRSCLPLSLSLSLYPANWMLQPIRMCVQDRQSVLFEAGVAAASAKLHMHPGVGLLDTIPHWRRLYVAWCSQCEQLVPEAHNISMKLYGISFHITTFFLTS